MMTTRSYIIVTVFTCTDFHKCMYMCFLGSLLRT
jgi:hypothetical protein